MLLAAAALRFTALGWGLRHPAHVDERPFVDAAAAMVVHHDLDHRFYEYPGLFLYLLAAALGLTGALPPSPAAYLAARAVVAACSVLSVALAFRLGRALGGPGAGLLAAALLALSPAEVRVAHMVRPDVVLETLALVALLLCLDLGDDGRGDLRAGVAVGAATAVKFSGALVFAAYLARRAVAPGFRWSRLALGGGAALAAYACFSPFTFLRWDTAVTGARTQLLYHYEGHEYLALTWLETARDYLSVFSRAVGPLGLILAVGAAWLRREEWRRWVHVAVLPVVMVAVFSSAEVHRLRFMAAGFGALAVMAALGAESLALRRIPRLALVLALLLPPAAESALYVVRLARPGTRDRLLDWVQAGAPAGARLVSLVGPTLGIDPHAHELVVFDHLDDRSYRAALEGDLVLGSPADARVLAGFSRLADFAPQDPEAGPHLVVLAPTPAARPPYVPIPLTAGMVSTSPGAGDPARLVDGDLHSCWDAGTAATRFVEVRFPAPEPIGRVRLRLGDCGQAEPPPRLKVPHHHPGPGLHLMHGDGQSLRPLETVDARPPVALQGGPPGDRGPVLLVDAVAMGTLRVVLPESGRWAIAELDIDRLDRPLRPQAP